MGKLVFETSEIRKKFDYTDSEGNLLVKGDATLQDPSRKVVVIRGRCYHKDEEGNFNMLYGDFTINGTKDPATYSLSEMSRQDYFDTLDAMDDIMEQIEGTNAGEE